MKIVKKNGQLQDFDSTKLIKTINAVYKSVETLDIIKKIEKELNTSRFKEFYPNTHNISDLVEKYVMLGKNEQK